MTCVRSARSSLASSLLNTLGVEASLAVCGVLSRTWKVVYGNGQGCHYTHSFKHFLLFP